MVDVACNHLDVVKRELSQTAKIMQAGDRAYLYSPEQTTVFRHPGELVGAVMNATKLGGINIEHALKQTVYIMSIEDMDAGKYVILLIDGETKFLERYVRKGLKLDLKEDVGCEFLLCSLVQPSEVLKNLCNVHPRCHYLHIEDPSSLASKLKSMCVNDNPPNYCPLDIQELRKEFYG